MITSIGLSNGTYLPIQPRTFDKFHQLKYSHYIFNEGETDPGTIDNLFTYRFTPYKNKCNQEKNKYDSYYLNFFDQLKTKNILPIFFIDTYNLFCKNKLCSMAKNNELLYRDDNHLNINGSIYLGKKFLYEIKQN